MLFVDWPLFASSLRPSSISANLHRTQSWHHLSTLRQRCCTAALDALQAWPWGIAELAGLLRAMSQTKVAGAGEGIVGGSNEEASPSLRHLPHVGPVMDLSTTPSTVHFPLSLVLLAECFDPILLLLCSDHFCDNKLFSLFPCGFGPKLGSSTSVVPVVCFVQRGLCWRGSGASLATC